MTEASVILSPSLHVILTLNPSFLVILSRAKDLVVLRAGSVKGKNLVPLRTGSAKNPSHSSGRRLEILRRPDVSALLRMTLLRALL